MPFVPAADTVEVEIRMTQDSQQIENTLYFDLGAAPTTGAMVTLMNDIFDWWTTNIAPLVSETVVLREIVVTDLSSSTGPQVSFTPPVEETGSAGGAPYPNSTTFAISFRTNLRGRSFRGRNYVVGLTEDQVTANTVHTVTVNDYIAAYGLILTGALADDGVWSVVSRFSGVDPDTGKPIPRVSAVVTPIRSVVVVDATVDNQRRRLPGRGK